MNINSNSNFKLSFIDSLFITSKHTNKGIRNIYTENTINEYKKTNLESIKDVNSKKVSNILEIIIELGDKITKTDKSQLNLLNKSQFNSKISNSENINNKLTKPILNKSNSILKIEQQYIKLLTPFNSKLASFTNHIYTFTNRPYKKINKILYSLYLICKSVFLNMSSIISKPVVSINPNLIKITLFYYWKPLREEYYDSNLHSKFLILYNNKLKILVNYLSKLFKKSVELELIRIYSPQNESNILANLIGILSNFIKFKYICMKLFKLSKTKNINTKCSNTISNENIPSYLSGIYFKLAGRVLTQLLQKRVKPRIIQKGTFSRTRTSINNINKFVNKSKRGTFCITIKTGHIINN